MRNRKPTHAERADWVLILVTVLSVAGAIFAGYFYHSKLPTTRVSDTKKYFGIYTNKLDSQGAEQIKYLGANIVRTDVFAWDVIEPQKGRYDFSSADRTVAWAKENDLELLGVLLYTPPWESGLSFTPKVKESADCGIPPRNELENSSNQFRVQPPVDYGDFARFVYKTVRRYPYVRYWQIWNEPNNPIFWQPKPDAAQYAKMLKAVHRAVRRANPRANIVMGGLSLVDLKYLENLYGEGAAEYFDILAVHPYNPAQSPAAYLGHEFLNLKAVMAGAGDIDKKIWITELGWHTSTSTTGVSQREQAEYVTQLYELAESMDAVQAVFWHTLEDCGIGFRAGNPEHNFGLFNGNHLAKPSARAYREAVNAYGKRQ